MTSGFERQRAAGQPTRIMGVLNVTPDSFSDGGRWLDPDAAVAWGLRLAEEGADIVDVGGESTRPGAEPVAEAEELRRVVPVVEALAPRVTVSVDTRTRAVAEAALAAGASILNDVSARLAAVAAEAGATWIAMHMQGDPQTMQTDPRYDDVVAEVTDFLRRRAEQALAAGVPDVWVDPGIGFGKTTAHNLSLLGDLGRVVALGYPVVVGTSRKGFLGALHAATDGVEAVPAGDRLEGSVATAVWAAHCGAAVVRVHDVLPTRHALRIVQEPVFG